MVLLATGKIAGCFWKLLIFEAMMNLNLDSKTGREIMDILKLTNQKYNQTILLVTHDDRIALQASRIITIGDGKIVKDEVMKQ